MNTSLYIAAAISGALGTAASLPFWGRWCRRMDLLDEPGLRKIHHEPVPLAGGLAIITGMILAFITCSIAARLGVLAPMTLDRRLLIVLIGAAGMLLLGILDDKFDLCPAHKFAGQLLIALLVAAAGIRITLFIPWPPLHFVLTVLWILAVVNAFNFIDNMNGLCAGLAAIAAVTLGIITAGSSQQHLASWAFIVTGALLGFLPFNFPRASVFLGDSGSHLLGFLLAVLTILPDFYSAQNPRPWAVLTPLLLLSLPLIDLIRVVVWRWQQGRPFYIGDTSHISHLLVRFRFTPAAAVLLLWLISAALSSLALFWN